MTTVEVQHEALSRAQSGQSVANYGSIFEGFAAKGIAESEIRPRENVFTFHAWKALGRSVRKGERGVRVCTWVPVPGKVDAETGEQKPGFRRPKSAVVFHVSQTEPITGAIPKRPCYCGLYPIEPGRAFYGEGGSVHAAMRCSDWYGDAIPGGEGAAREANR